MFSMYGIKATEDSQPKASCAIPQTCLQFRVVSVITTLVITRNYVLFYKKKLVITTLIYAFLGTYGQ